jgi:iron complex transport system substrate-binding protein
MIERQAKNAAYETRSLAKPIERSALRNAGMSARYPERIVCLTEETTETLYRIGEEQRIVGISGYTVRPARARREKPKVSAFLSAKIDKILALEPDLVLAFSDLQADIARDLAKHGLNVVLFNQRSIDEILSMILVLSSMVGATGQGEKLVAELERELAEIRESASHFVKRPRVYFEEWDEPMISGIRWVSELVGVAGGEDVFPELSRSQAASGRIIADGAEVVRRKPDLILGSWCGKKFRPEKVVARAGWDNVPAVRDGELHEIKSADILQPGPAALTDGVRRIHELITAWDARQRG